MGTLRSVLLSSPVNCQLLALSVAEVLSTYRAKLKQHLWQNR
jgi:hypothetical protein